MKRSPKIDMPRLAIGRHAEALPEQLCRAIREAIAAGGLEACSRLPGSRVLARMLGVSRNTVLAAYETLSIEGLISGRVGSGTRVCAQARSIVRLLAANHADKVLRLRESGFPLESIALRDPDGHGVYIHR